LYCDSFKESLILSPVIWIYSRMDYHCKIIKLP